MNEHPEYKFLSFIFEDVETLQQIDDKKKAKKLKKRRKNKKNDEFGHKDKRVSEGVITIDDEFDESKWPKRLTGIIRREISAEA